MDSSSTLVCSGDVPCLLGSWARSSFSTCARGRSQRWSLRRGGRRGGEEDGRERRTDGDFEIHHLLRERAHLVVETETVFPRICGREHEITLSLLLVFHDYLLVRAHHAVVDVEGAAGLYLRVELKVSDCTYECLAPI